MSVMESIRNNSSTAAIIAGVVLLLALFLILRGVSGTSSARFEQPKWMYNLNTGQLVVGDASTHSPNNDGSGTFDYGPLGSAGAVVDAIVVTCGNPTAVKDGMTLADLEGVDASIAYLVRASNNEPKEGHGFNPAGGLVSDISGKEWFSQLSKEGQDVTTNNYKACNDGKLPKRTRP
ncbi:MAG: hypothetical protein AAGA25_16780 [Planctomycetota bacterium]